MGQDGGTNNYSEFSFTNYKRTAFISSDLMKRLNDDHVISSSQITDDELLRMLAGDDQVAFKTIYDRYWKKLYVIAAHRVVEEQDAEEIVQDIFASLWFRRRELVISADGLGKYLTASVKYRVDDCVDYVTNELDKAAEVLPLQPQQNGQSSDAEYGRITKGICLAVKARLLLYAASPQYNGNNEVAGFVGKDGSPLISQSYDVQKWKKAADASKPVT